MRRIDGRVAVITGAGSGIGRATAIELAEHGASLALVDLQEEAIAETAEAVEGRGVAATMHIADVSDPQRMAELPAEVVAAHGSCHILVNNAGVLSVGQFADESLNDISWMVGVNVFGVIHGCHFFLPNLREVDEAHIVNVSSMAAFVGLPQNAAYSLTKGAIRSFTEALRGELLSTHIGVSMLMPGAVDTHILDSARGSQAKRLAAFSAGRNTRFMRRSATAAGRQIVSAIQHNKPRVLLGPDSRTLDIGARLLPSRNGLVARILDRLS